ncbi:hypothetical protein THRCLA_08035 [Thraustotheca clavata]|uniref:WRKY transcription factor 19 n=1 Tax=Thraustotheca clavata TaxID=74557 RepID=A0A1V9ZAT9_9STRA|nr:hypothetical protein THRCLA_08035 [Thraustotheca clavata]
MSSSMLCQFKSCSNPVMPRSTKCEFHKNRSECSVPHCSNQVFARKLCVRHGGRPVCQFAGCTANAHRRGYCCRHGIKGLKKPCTEPGCTRLAQSKQKCVRHGGGRPCHKEGCNTHARTGGFCSRHAVHARPNEMVVDDSGMKIFPTTPTSYNPGHSIVLPSLRCLPPLQTTSTSWNKYRLETILCEPTMDVRYHTTQLQ